MLAFCYFAFVCFGVVLVLLGANQAEVAAELGLDLQHSGLLASALALGLGVGVVGAGPLFDRLPRGPLFAGSMLLAAIALLSVDESLGFARVFALMACVGLGIGAYDTLINAVVAERFRERSAKPMSVVHSAATVGAMFGPFFAGWLALHGHWSAGFRLAGVAHLALAGWACFLRFPAPPHTHEQSAPEAVVPWARLLPFAAVAFAYVGVESSVTLFAVPYATDALRQPESRGLFAISAFWLGLFTGRMLLLLPRGPIGPRVLQRSGLCACGVLALGVAAGVRHVELLFAAAGLALGSVYPVMIALAGQRFPRARGTAAGLAAGAGALGGFGIPWLTGAAGDAWGIAVAFGSLALWCLAIALAAATTTRPPLASPRGHS